MVVKAVVNSASRAPDKLYDYLVPEEFEERIRVGSRIRVPFGAANKEIEGYVFEIKQKSRAKKLKQVSAVYDRAFDEKMLDVIKWLRDECVCSYLDVIKTVVPQGSVNKPEQWLEIAENVSAESEPILKAIAANGGACEINSLLAMFDEDISRSIEKLIGEGKLKRVYRDSVKVKAKRIRTAELTDSESVEESLEALRRRRAYSQARMVEILKYTGRVSLADLVRFSEGSYAAVRALEKHGLIRCADMEVSRSPVAASCPTEGKKQLTAEQKTAYEAVAAAVEKNEFSEFLLWGVTGSGKTEVFLQAIERCINMGRRAVMLVPEISLTPQMVSRFGARFGGRIAVFHSGLSMGERFDEWCRIRRGEADIIIGARSAVFAPADNIGIIIMDEEHEQSYKSEMQPRYNTCDVARFRAKQHKAVLLCASATPKIESYYDAASGRVGLLELKKRFNENAMPETAIVDMRAELAAGNRSILSQKLREEIEINLERKEQTILFLNRRGFSTFVSCRACGYTASCPNCSISLTYHKFNDTLRCHYCGYTIPNYAKCPSCGSSFIRYFGGGTQKVEDEIHRLFPQASVIRMDNDTTAGKNGHERILSEFERTGADILVGTQMVAKGLDFPNVTLVGVISADTSLHADDFRASERTFELLEQVVGRAGRADKQGRAVIQTYTPEHPAVVLAKKHDYLNFYSNEIKIRKALQYPPFCMMVSVGFSGAADKNVAECAKFYARALAKLEQDRAGVRLIGPIRAAISRIKNKYRWQLIIKAPRTRNISAELAEAQKLCRRNRNFDGVSIVADKNPNTIY